MTEHLCKFIANNKKMYKTSDDHVRRMATENTLFRINKRLKEIYDFICILVHDLMLSSTNSTVNFTDADSTYLLILKKIPP